MEFYGKYLKNTYIILNLTDNIDIDINAFFNI